MTVAAILLAAGRSTRFGTANKLAAMLGDLPLGLRAARALAPLRLASLFVVTNCDDISWAPLVKIPNGRPDVGMAYSIALGLNAARSAGLEERHHEDQGRKDPVAHAL